MSQIKPVKKEKNYYKPPITTNNASQIIKYTLTIVTILFPQEIAVAITILILYKIIDELVL